MTAGFPKANCSLSNSASRFRKRAARSNNHSAWVILILRTLGSSVQRFDESDGFGGAVCGIGVDMLYCVCDKFATAPVATSDIAAS